MLDKRPIHVLHLNQSDNARSHAIQFPGFCLSKIPTRDLSTISNCPCGALLDWSIRSGLSCRLCFGVTWGEVSGASQYTNTVY